MNISLLTRRIVKIQVFSVVLLAGIVIVGTAVEAHGQGGLRWVRGGGSIPSNAVEGGTDSDGSTLYVCRTSHRGTSVPGKVVGSRCNYNWGTTEYNSSTFDILVGSGAYWTRNLNTRTAVVGGASNTETYYVCRANASGGSHPGRMQGGKCNYGFGGRGYAATSFEVLNGNVRNATAGVSLLDAATRADTTAVRAALRAGQAINQKNAKGQTALMLAASKRAADVVRILLNEGATVDVRDNEGFTALGYAAFYGDAYSVRHLLRAGANLGSRTDAGHTPLYYAAASGDVATVRAILADGSFRGLDSGVAGFPLHGAAAYDRVAIIDMLINDEEIDADRLDANGQTAIMVAARNNKAAAVRALLRSGADLSIRTANNWEIFGLAAVSNATDVLGVLLTSEKFSVRSPIAESALRLTARDSKIPALNYLIQRGVDPNAVQRDVGSTPLMLAATAGHDGVTEALLKARVNVNAKNNRGETALILAASGGKRDVVKLLIKAGADVNAADNNGKTALQYATQNNHNDTRKDLEKAGAQ